MAIALPTMRDTNTHYGDQVTRAMNRPFLTAAILLSFLTATISAQDLERHDTLTAAIKTDSRRVISPLGEGDPIRWAQGLPGVTTGADGTTAFYVRGGNMGNNLITLDGVPVYGYSHLLGGFDNFGAGVGDVYGRFRWQTGKRSVLNG